MWDRLPGQRVYAVLHDTNGRALDFSDPTPSLKVFDGDHNRFGEELIEDSVRKGYFSSKLTTGTFILPDSVYGEDYDIEFWATAYSGTFNRLTDTLLDYEKLPFASGGKGHAIELQILSNSSKIPEVPSGAKYESLVSFSYDSSNGRLSYSCWLEKDGQLQTDTQSCTLTLVDSSGNAVLSEQPVSPASGVDAISGYFVGDVLSIELLPDEAYSGTCTIVDANDASHTSGVAPVTWD